MIRPSRYYCYGATKWNNQANILFYNSFIHNVEKLFAQSFRFSSSIFEETEIPGLKLKRCFWSIMTGDTGGQNFCFKYLVI